jgi:hypothetical protein
MLKGFVVLKMLLDMVATQLRCCLKSVGFVIGRPQGNTIAGFKIMGIIEGGA